MKKERCYYPQSGQGGLNDKIYTEGELRLSLTTGLEVASPVTLCESPICHFYSLHSPTTIYNYLIYLFAFYMSL